MPISLTVVRSVCPLNKNEKQNKIKQEKKQKMMISMKRTSKSLH